jgi:hypothetical protein
MAKQTKRKEKRQGKNDKKQSSWISIAALVEGFPPLVSGAAVIKRLQDLGNSLATALLTAKPAVDSLPQRPRSISRGAAVNAREAGQRGRCKGALLVLPHYYTGDS